jgi:hypothetical protein
MTRAGILFSDHPGLYLQSHLAENRAEVAQVREMYPAARSYLDVYDGYRQLGPRAVFAHCIWLDDADRRRIAETGTAMSFLPDFESVPRIGSVRSGARRRARSPRRHRHRRGCRHEFLDAAHARRSLQGAATPGADRSRRNAPSISPRSAVHKASTSTTGSATSSRARRPISSCSTPTRPRSLRVAWRAPPRYPTVSSPS